MKMFWCITKKQTRRLFAGLAGAVALAIVLPVALQEPQAVAVSRQEWGLSFQEGNAEPTPNRSAEELRPYNAFYRGDTSKKRLYLTFDAGYENGNTAPILDALKKHNAQGAFFVVASYIKENPELIARMVAEGHIVGNHSYHHPDMSQKNKEGFVKELTDLEAVFTEATGQQMQKFYRPPMGKFSEENLTWANELGYRTILWSLAYVDWNTDNQPSAEKAFSKLLPRTHDGAIVLLHSTSATNAQILDELLTKWEEMGYTFGSLTELGQAAPAENAAANQTTPAA